MADGDRDPRAIEARSRARSITLDDIAKIRTAVAVVETKVEGLDGAVKANANAIAIDTRDERNRRPTVIAVLAVVVALGGQVKACAFDAARIPSKGDVAEVRVEAATRSREFDDRLRELDRAVADLRTAVAAARASLDAIEAARRAGAARRER